ncbi:MAG: hypothetical protein K9N21_21900 [Deltaproteobacteria bacterium]|nr:hypothetical protein [Deltaproteobacteria bacterium]
MKSQKRISSRALSFIFFSCIGLLLSIGVPPGLYGAEYVSPEDREIYFKALEDTETATQAEVVRNLLAIVPGQNWANYNLLHGDSIAWENPEKPDNSRVLVVAFMNRNDFEQYYQPNLGKEYDLQKAIWVTVVPELKNYLVGKACPPTNERIRQALGLNPAYSYEALVEMYIKPSDLFRPSPDPEITDHQAELATKLDYSIWVFPSDQNPFLKIDEDALFLDSPWDWKGAIPFKNWFMNRAETIYDRQGEDVANWGYPWTRLGYTYDWGNPDDHVGLSEFVVRVDPYQGKVNVKLVRGILYGEASWDAYFRCGPAAPRLTIAKSENGVTLSWPSVSGADGYQVLYSASERGAPFTPPFKNELDLGDASSLYVEPAPGACFYAAVQGYNQQGLGDISNIGYIYIPTP